MAGLAEFFGSSAALLVLCAGVSLTMGLLHLWMARRPWDASWWVGLWSGLACVFLTARGVQLTTTDPASALFAAKVSLSIGPYLVWALVGFGRNLNGGSLERETTRRLGFVSVLWTVLIFATPWFVEPEVTTRTDFFGREHLSIESRWPTMALGVYIVATLIGGVRRLRRGNALEPGERRVLVAGFSVYALLGVGALLTSVSILEMPAMAEFGPFVVALCLSHLMVQRQRKTEGQLAALLDEKTSRLEASEERYRDLVDHAPVGVVAYDARGELIAINPRMIEMLNGPPSDAKQARSLDPTILAEIGLLDLVDEITDRRHPLRREQRLVLPDSGESRIWQITASLLEAESDGSHVLLIADDVTERTHLERQLYQAQKMDSIGQLAAGIAHEINNPMSFVRSNLAAIAMYKQEIDAELRESNTDTRKSEALVELDTLIGESIEGVERTITIVRDMREFAHGGQDEEPSADLAQVLDSCVRFASVFHHQGAEIVYATPSSREVGIASGPLRQVFLNLLINSLQAIGDKGRVWVDASLDPPFARIRVRDDGPGVPEELWTRIFDPFFTTKPVGEGTGLGLYISYQIVRGCGGDLRIATGPEGGACFEVALPLAEH